MRDTKGVVQKRSTERYERNRRSVETSLPTESDGARILQLYAGKASGSGLRRFLTAKANPLVFSSRFKKTSRRIGKKIGAEAWVRLGAVEKASIASIETAVAAKHKKAATAVASKLRGLAGSSRLSGCWSLYVLGFSNQAVQRVGHEPLKEASEERPDDEKGVGFSAFGVCPLHERREG